MRAMAEPSIARRAATRLAAALVLLGGSAPGAAEAAPEPPARSYYVYVCAESDDEVSVVRLGPGGVEVMKTLTVGSYPT